MFSYSFHSFRYPTTSSYRSSSLVARRLALSCTTASSAWTRSLLKVARVCRSTDVVDRALFLDDVVVGGVVPCGGAINGDVVVVVVVVS